MNLQTNPVNIRGVDYPSQKSAAEAFGVTQGHVSKALNMGRADTIGIGKPRIPVPVGGITYPTMAAASKALGVSYSKIRCFVRRAATAKATP